MKTIIAKGHGVIRRDLMCTVAAGHMDELGAWMDGTYRLKHSDLVYFLYVLGLGIQSKISVKSFMVTDRER